MHALSHRKRYHATELQLPDSTLVVEGPVPSEVISNYTFHEGLRAFRPALQQQKAIEEIADLPEGRVIIAREGNVIAAYVTFLYPDPLERWSQGNMEDLLELGAIEVAAPWRHGGTAKKLLEVAFMDDAMNDYIVISTEYYWHWDLEGTHLSVWDYKEVMKKVMGSVGMEYFATDDPEITCHPANMLMARIGTRVPLESIEKFNEIRFQSRYMY
ncbi:N-acetyltransferase [Fodinisporobacter ferrooxydans]|uniref:N-acetyltransferase n=1 Tax=Fodinisporobacter ferrooxydans TaxID=2901836 RepID=A0ABY4CI88_9BACL|nr:N-acetyltransferase [Alicyclobacillaceae bacterium MYW30-H2]